MKYKIRTIGRQDETPAEFEGITEIFVVGSAVAYLSNFDDYTLIVVTEDTRIVQRSPYHITLIARDVLG